MRWRRSSAAQGRNGGGGVSGLYTLIQIPVRSGVPSGERGAGPAMSPFLGLELSPNESDDIMRCHPSGFIDEQDAVRSSG